MHPRLFSFFFSMSLHFFHLPPPSPLPDLFSLSSPDNFPTGKMCQARKRVQAGIQIVEIEIQPDIWGSQPMSL